MSRHGRVTLALLSILTILTMLAGACTPSPAPTPSGGQQPADTAAPKPTAVVAPTTAPAKPKIVTITFVQEPDNLNPIYTNMYFTAILRDFYLMGLWNFDDQGQPVPQIAAEIPSQANGGISADNLTFTIKLRPDAKWSDGEPITAEDFVFTYDMIISDKNTGQSRYPYDVAVDSVTAKDAQTLVVQFKEPFAPWLTSLFTYVLPKHTLQPVFEKDGTLDQAEWNRKPDPGVGPFVFKEWSSGSHLSFVKNTKHWQPPKVEQIFVRVVPDDAAQLAAIKAGDTDIGVFLSTADVPDLQALGTVDTPLVGSGYDEAIFFNMAENGHPALKDPDVRRAIGLAINREEIVKELLLGVTPVAATYWDTTPPYHDPAIQPPPYDPDQAKQLLDAAGWKDPGTGVREKDGVKLHLRYITNQREVRKSVQAVVQQQLLAVGIETELINYNSDVYFNSFGQGGPVATGQYDLAEWSQNTAYPDPDTSVFLCSEIPSAEQPEGQNWSGYCDPEVDRLLQEQRTETDQAKRIDLFAQIQQIMYDETLWLGMWQDPDIWSTAKRISGIKMSGSTPFWNSYDWDIP